MPDIKYYHGAKYSLMGSCNAHKDKYTFWVYPSGQKPLNSWDTNIAATDYCNNHVDEGKAPSAPQLKQYVCLGHTNVDDMDVVKADWLKRGIKALSLMDNAKEGKEEKAKVETADKAIQVEAKVEEDPKLTLFQLRNARIQFYEKKIDLKK